MGHNFAGVNDLLHTLISEQIPMGWLTCNTCHRNLTINHGYSIHFNILPGTGRSTAEWINSMFIMDDLPQCIKCNAPYCNVIHLPKVPHIVTFDISTLSS